MVNDALAGKIDLIINCKKTKRCWSRDILRKRKYLDI